MKLIPLSPCQISARGLAALGGMYSALAASSFVFAQIAEPKFPPPLPAPAAQAPAAKSPPLAAKPTAATAANQCWSPAELAGHAGDKTIVKDTPRAIVDPPREVLAPYSPAARGAIRRVELPPGVKKIAFTFDNCEQPYEVAGYDAEIVNTLRANNVRATFFAGGKWMMTHPEQAQQLLSDPLFEVGNHSWEHRNLRLLEGQRQVDEIRWAQTAYERQVTALDKRQCVARDGRPFTKTKANARMGLFRFPFGACNPAALDAAAELGVLPIQWDVSSGDPTKGLAPEKMATETMRRIRPGSIVLFHANGRGWSTAAALKIMIPALKANGFEFATVGDLLNTKGATVDRRSNLL